jgi:hypothetical protein
MNFLRRKLTSLGVVLLALVIFVSGIILSTRAIWMDEAMLLRSIYEIGFLDIFKALPYFDQASPAIPVLILKFISIMAGTNIEQFRILIFIVTAAFAIPLLRWITKEKGMAIVAAFLFTCIATLYSIIFYTTEIKHYGFEIAGVMLFLYWFLIYLENRVAAISAKLIWIPVFSVYVGFSTLLLVPALFTFIIINTVYARKNKIQSLDEAIREHRWIAILLLVTFVIGYYQMKQLTVFQINNTWSQNVYGGQGFFVDASRLFKSAFIPYSIIGAIVTLTAIFLNSKTIVFKLNIFFIELISIILILKVLGLYPVLSGRHLVWLLPISILITALVMSELLRSKNRFQHFLLVAILMLLIPMFGRSIFKMTQGVNAEITSNNDLYLALGKEQASDVLVYVNARPSLEISQLKNKTEHKYYGFVPNGNLSSMKKYISDQDFTDWQFSQLPQTKSFLMLLSHSEHFEFEPAESKLKALRATFSKNNCNYDSIYRKTSVQILRVHCK